MNCNKCGAPLMEHDMFCRNCGAAVNGVNAQNQFDSNINNYQQSNNVDQTVNYQQVQESQPQQMPPQNYGYTYSTTQTTYADFPQKKNNLKVVFIGIIVLLAVIVIAMIIVIASILGSNNGGEEVLTPPTSNEEEVVTTNKKSNYTVKFNGFTFKIPTDLIYEVEDESILLGDEDGTWVAYIEVVEGSYNQLLTNKNQLQGIYQQAGYTSSSAVEKTIGGNSYLTLELTMSGTNALLGFTKANSMNVFGATIYTLDNNFDYDILEEVSEIFENAEYTGETNNMSVLKKIDLNGISNLAK